MTKVRSLAYVCALFMFMALSTLISGCESSGNNPDSLGTNSNRPDNIAPPATVISGPSQPPAPSPPAPSANHMTIAVKFVALKNATSDAPSPTQAQVETMLANISTVWAQCDIGFVLEDYASPVASDDQLVYNVATFAQMDDMRAKYQDGAHALYVKTGMWDRTQDFSGDGSQGYSSIPPSTYEGTILQQDMALSTLLVAHESGHLIGGLQHVTDTTNLMDHIVSNTALTASQCDQARSTMLQYHAAWIR